MLHIKLKRVSCGGEMLKRTILQKEKKTKVQTYIHKTEVIKYYLIRHTKISHVKSMQKKRYTHNFFQFAEF